MRSLLLGGLALACASLCNAAETEVQGLVAHYYGNPDFQYHAGTFPTTTLELKTDLNKLKWPENKWEKSECVFNRLDGWSLVIRGSLDVKKAGEYRFSCKGALAEMKLGSALLEFTAGKEPKLSLPEGKSHFELFVKSPNKPHDFNLALDLKWQGPGMDSFESIPAAVLSHGEGDVKTETAFNPDILLENPSAPFIGMRDYAFEIPADGFYRLDMQFKGVPDYGNISLDGHFLYHYKAGNSGLSFGFLGSVGTTRHLAKGPHTLRYASHGFPWEFLDIDLIVKDLRIGWSRVSAENPERTFCVTEKDRDDMVFEMGDPLSLKIEQATSEPMEYKVEVFEQRSSNESAIWSKTVSLPGGNSHALVEVKYPCDKEGAFEYKVSGKDGKELCGPWSFVVVDSTPIALPKADAPPASTPKVLIDSVDCTQTSDDAHHFRDNGTSDVLDSPSGKYRASGSKVGTRGYKKEKDNLWRVVKEAEQPDASYATLDWFAYTMKVKNPGRPHMLTAYVPNDMRRNVVIRAYDQVTGNSNGALIDTGDAPQAGPVAKLSFLLWPNGKAIDVTSFGSAKNHGGDPKAPKDQNRQGAVIKFELYELPDGLPALPEASAGWAKDKEFGWQGEQLDIGMEQRMMPRLWSGNEMVPGVMDAFAFGRGGYNDWKALLDTWSRFGQFSMWRGDNLLIWPVSTYGLSYLNTNLMPNCDEAYGKGFKYRPVDRMRRDQLKMILLLCRKYHVQLVIDFHISRIYANTIAMPYGKDGRVEGEDGLFVTAMNGKPLEYPTRILNPAHPISRRYLLDMIGEIAAKYGSIPAFQGIHFRQTGWYSNNSAWFANMNTGFDDFTVSLFEKETGLHVPVASDDPDKARKRRDFLLGDAKEKWFSWRCEKVTSLRKQLLETLRKNAPQARLYGDSDVFAREAGLDASALEGNRDLGYGARDHFGGSGVEYNGLDPIEYANFDIREGVVHRTLDALMGHREYAYPMGFCTGHGSSIRCAPYQLEDLSRTLAEKPLETVLYGGCWIPPSLDEGLRAWAQAWRAIPELKYQKFPEEGSKDHAFACWQAKRGSASVFYLVNRTDIRRKAKVSFASKTKGVRDLVYGTKLPDGESLELEVEPFMLRVVEAGDSTGVSAVEALPDSASISRLERMLSFLEAMKGKAKGLQEIQRGRGDRCVDVIVGEEPCDDRSEDVV